MSEETDNESPLAQGLTNINLQITMSVIGDIEKINRHRIQHHLALAGLDRVKIFQGDEGFIIFLKLPFYLSPQAAIQAIDRAIFRSECIETGYFYPTGNFTITSISDCN